MSAISIDEAETRIGKLGKLGNGGKVVSDGSRQKLYEGRADNDGRVDVCGRDVVCTLELGQSRPGRACLCTVSQWESGIRSDRVFAVRNCEIAFS